MKKLAQEQQSGGSDDTSPYASLFTQSSPSSTAEVQATPVSDSAEFARNLGNAAMALQGAGIGTTLLDSIVNGRGPLAESNARAEQRINDLTADRNAATEQANNAIERIKNERDALAAERQAINDSTSADNKAAIQRALTSDARVRAYSDWMNALNQRIAAIQDVRMTPDGSAIDVSALPARTQKALQGMTPEQVARLFPDVGASILYAANEKVPHSAIPGTPPVPTSPFDPLPSQYQRLDEIALRFANPDAANAYDQTLRSRVLSELTDPTKYHSSAERAQQHPSYTTEIERAKHVKAVSDALGSAMTGNNPEIRLGNSGLPEFSPELYLDPETGLPAGRLKRVPGGFYALSRDFPELFPDGVRLNPDELARTRLPDFDPSTHDSRIEALRQSNATVTENYNQQIQSLRDQIAAGRIPPNERPGPWRRGLHTAARIATPLWNPWATYTNRPYLRNLSRGPAAALDMLALGNLGNLLFGGRHSGMNYYTTTPNITPETWENMDRK